MHLHGLGREELLAALHLRAHQVDHVFRVSQHVLVYGFLGLVLSATEVTNVEIRFDRPGHQLSYYFLVLLSLSAGRIFAEVNVEPVERVHAAVAGMTLEPGEGGAVLPVLQGPLPRAQLQPAVRADGFTLHIILQETQELHVLALITLVQLALGDEEKVLLEGSQPPEPLLAGEAHVLDVPVGGGALAPMLP